MEISGEVGCVNFCGRRESFVCNRNINYFSLNYVVSFIFLFFRYYFVFIRRGKIIVV